MKQSKQDTLGIPPFKKFGSHNFYRKTHFIAFLDSSHLSGSSCDFKFFLTPNFDQVMTLFAKLCFGDPKLAPESFGHQLRLTGFGNNSFQYQGYVRIRRKWILQEQMWPKIITFRTGATQNHVGIWQKVPKFIAQIDSGCPNASGALYSLNM